MNPLAMLAILHAATVPNPIIPKPTSAQWDTDHTFQVSKSTHVDVANGCEAEGRMLKNLLHSGRGAGPSGTIHLSVDPALDLNAEGYTLQITPSDVRIKGKTTAGIFYGIQTLAQLMPISGPTAVPCGEVTDQPKFPWRGMLLDVSRHFFPPKDIKHFLDLLAMQKMNVFHWHLVDDGGWRIEIKRYPKLTSVGAWRTPSKEIWNSRTLSFPGPGTGEKLYGGFYTQAEIRDIVQYAADRHITVVPEIEIPGHSLASVAAYPELACTAVSAADFMKASGMPSANVYCAGKDSTFTFLENVLDEVMDLFPSKTIHIGGDEVDKYLWKHCPDCQKRMQDEGLKNADELQSYFIRRIEKYVNSKGRHIIGWDEILEGGLAPNAQVMSWRGIEGGIAAAKAGHDVVMTPTSHCYFDYSYSDISTEHVLTFNPIPDALTPEEGKHVLGGQCNLWAEWVPDRATAEQRLFPRMLAMAEVLWAGTPEDTTDFNGRLRAFYPRLESLGLNFYLPTPESEYDAIILGSGSTVNFHSVHFAGSSIRYTEDGSEPTVKSPVFTAPITPTHPGVFTAALFLKGGQRSDLTRVVVAAPPAVNADQLQPGLTWQLFKGSWDEIPDMSKLTAAAHGAADTVDLVGGLSEHYALAFDGFIKVPDDGTYRFFLTSDDGSVMSIAGATVVDNDGAHGAIEKGGRIVLKKGVYPIHIGYFQIGGAQSLKMGVEGPGTPKQVVPASWLFH